jgi:N,N-dimethylformamidase
MERHPIVPSPRRCKIGVLRGAASTLAKRCYFHITFIVTKAASKPKSDIVLVVPTNTFIAYNAKPFRSAKPGLLQLSQTSHGSDESIAPGEPGFSAYTPHQSGVPAFNVGLRMPMPSFDPYNRYVLKSYGHLMQPVRAVQTWLESSGYAYDVITDLDLHDGPTLLAGYKAVILAGHSEYWTSSAYDHVKDYLAANGNVLVLSGNTMFWRVSFDSARTVMECRKIDCGGTTESPRRHGETWHSDDGQRGGLMRECGYPAYPLLGLETAAIMRPTSPASVSTIAAPGHFLFEGVNLDAFGANLAGHEVDCRIATLEANRRAAGKDAPAHATMPVEDASIVTLATSSGGQATALYDFFARDLPPTTTSNRGDLVYWERADGGKVVNVGSIRAGLSLRTDPEFGKFVRNVLTHFDVPVPG